MLIRDTNPGVGPLEDGGGELDIQNPGALVIFSLNMELLSKYYQQRTITYVKLNAISSPGPGGLFSNTPVNPGRGILKFRIPQSPQGRGIF